MKQYKFKMLSNNDEISPMASQFIPLLRNRFISSNHKRHPMVDPISSGDLGVSLFQEAPCSGQSSPSKHQSRLQISSYIRIIKWKKALRTKWTEIVKLRRRRSSVAKLSAPQRAEPGSQVWTKHPPLKQSDSLFMQIGIISFNQPLWCEVRSFS